MASDDVPFAVVIELPEQYAATGCSVGEAIRPTNRLVSPFSNGRTPPLLDSRSRTRGCPMSPSRKSSGSLPKRKTMATPKGAELPVDRAFEVAVLKRAREVTLGYRLVIQPAEGLGFIGRSVELPGVMAGGKTHEQCVKAVVMATETAVAALLEMGETPPAPASARKRTEQINIRLTSEEKLLLEEESERKGFRGVSDFVRATVLSQV